MSLAIIVGVLLIKEFIDHLYEQSRYYTGDAVFALLCCASIYFFHYAGVGLAFLAWCERNSKLSRWWFAEGFLNTSASWARKYWLTDLIVRRRHWARPIVLNLVTPLSDGEHLFQLLFTAYLCLIMPGNVIANYLISTTVVIFLKKLFDFK
ncbi:MAG: hypothetical protein QXT25_03275 [Candidatus Anstonellaceae archaeon]